MRDRTSTVSPPSEPSNRFIKVRLDRNNQDTYLVRTAIERHLTNALSQFRGVLLDVGCGSQPYRELVTSPPSRVQTYVGMDFESHLARGGYRKIPDLTWDGSAIPLPGESIDTAMATEVLEHCPDPLRILKEIHRVLRPDGFFFLTTPFVWPLHDAPYDEYRYTTFAMERLLSEAGFRDIRVRPTGGWDASLAQMIGLWSRRRPMSPRARGFANFLTLPLVRLLAAREEIPDPETQPMIPGVWATCVKPGL